MNGVLLAFAGQPLRLALAAAMLWSAWFLALLFGQRLAGAERAAQRSWLLYAETLDSLRDRDNARTARQNARKALAY